MARSFEFTCRDGRAGVIIPARQRDARACLAIVADAVADRPRTLAVQEHEMWTVRDWRRNRLDWGRKGVWLVAIVDGRVVGQLTCDRGVRPTSHHVAEFGITVARDARGNGVGSALLDVLEIWAHEVGVTRIGLGVFSSNTRARALYERLGYQQEGIERRVVRFTDGDEDVIRMAKLLDEPAHEADDYDARPTTGGA